MRGRKKLPAERAIIYGAMLGGMSLEEVNSLLESIGAEHLNPSSYKMILSNELPYFKEALDPRLRDLILHPKSASAIRSELKSKKRK